MKLDTTSGKRILSRKIKSLLLLLLLIMADDCFAQPFNMLINAQYLATMQNVVVIDTRPSWRYLPGHIPGAVNSGNWRDFSKNIEGVPALNEDKNFIAERFRNLGIDYSKTIVIYGDAKDPWRTDGRFFWMFERFGFNKVSILDGGWDAWQESGGASERGSGKLAHPTSLAAQDIKMNDSAIAFQNWLNERLGSNTLTIIDNRTKKEFDGATPYGEKRGGHIPGAIHIDWQEFFTHDGKIKKKETLSALLDNYGVHADREVVVYCTGGVRSAMAYFVFRHLDYKVRNYDGSWWDWSHNRSLPAEQ